jgi:hypothetical protein
MARLINRGAALAAFGALVAGGVLGFGYVIRNIFESPTPGFRLTNGPGDSGIMGPGRRIQGLIAGAPFRWQVSVSCAARKAAMSLRAMPHTQPPDAG